MHLAQQPTTLTADPQMHRRRNFPAIWFMYFCGKNFLESVEGNESIYLYKLTRLLIWINDMVYGWIKINSERKSRGGRAAKNEIGPKKNINIEKVLAGKVVKVERGGAEGGKRSFIIETEWQKHESFRRWNSFMYFYFSSHRGNLSDSGQELKSQRRLWTSKE